MIWRHTGRDEGVPSLVIYAPIIDFDWAVFVEDNQSKSSFERLLRGMPWAEGGVAEGRPCLKLGSVSFSFFTRDARRAVSLAAVFLGCHATGGALREWQPKKRLRRRLPTGQTVSSFRSAIFFFSSSSSSWFMSKEHESVAWLYSDLDLLTRQAYSGGEGWGMRGEGWGLRGERWANVRQKVNETKLDEWMNNTLFQYN